MLSSERESGSNGFFDVCFALNFDESSVSVEKGLG